MQINKIERASEKERSFLFLWSLFCLLLISKNKCLIKSIQNNVLFGFDIS
jgi:hypothetical protein